MCLLNTHIESNYFGYMFIYASINRQIGLSIFKSAGCIILKLAKWSLSTQQTLVAQWDHNHFGDTDHCQRCCIKVTILKN